MLAFFIDFSAFGDIISEIGNLCLDKTCQIKCFLLLT